MQHGEPSTANQPSGERNLELVAEDDVVLDQSDSQALRTENARLNSELEALKAQLHEVGVQTAAAAVKCTQEEQRLRARLQSIKDETERVTSEHDAELARLTEQLNIARTQCKEAKSVRSVLIETEAGNQETLDRMMVQISEQEEELAMISSTLHEHPAPFEWQSFMKQAALGERRANANGAFYQANKGSQTLPPVTDRVYELFHMENNRRWEYIGTYKPVHWITGPLEQFQTTCQLRISNVVCTGWERIGYNDGLAGVLQHALRSSKSKQPKKQKRGAENQGSGSSKKRHKSRK
ncbi:uncharacterized protein BXZ73DRAFT_73982 [Epithele typhae]|uniref:uncharacterized protein n=1 Tax=Epithele typhae TaxID=378194 RepID=UPI002008B38A|nr:uncharacterized protein BXZ73DRAFT_73982 [Epithele typhae]KAH9944476.1 hypothetical protein BXZ73DRAFT_73982 [Epithele typhae]